jgi:putative tryptophan/tyrosine transport system substrate-binding protein
MHRRAFIAGIAGSALGGPRAVHAQPARLRRIGVLLAATESDSEYPALVQAFVRELRRLGWTGANCTIDIRWAGGAPEGLRKNAGALVALAPDVILAPGNSTVGPLLQSTRSIPIVFVIVPDPVGAGFVESLARPGGNATGFESFEYNIGGKWIELLREIAPRLKRLAVFRDTTIRAGVGQWGAVQTAASSLGLETMPINLQDANAIEQAVADFARQGDGGLIVTSSGRSIQHRDLIIAQAAHHKLPAVYYADSFVKRGGLVSYGPDRVDQFQRAAAYIDRILKGERPADLPVQSPTRYELIVNLKTAKALDIDLPPTLLGRADEVLE